LLARPPGTTEFQSVAAVLLTPNGCWGRELETVHGKQPISVDSFAAYSVVGIRDAPKSAGHSSMSSTRPSSAAFKPGNASKKQSQSIEATVYHESHESYE